MPKCQPYLDGVDALSCFGPGGLERRHHPRPLHVGGGARWAPGILGDLGARAIKVELLEGDPFAAHAGELFLRVNRGKERFSIDLKTSEGMEILRQLVAGADIFVHNFRPGAPERLAIDYESLRKINPRLVLWGAKIPSAIIPTVNMAGGR